VKEGSTPYVKDGSTVRPAAPPVLCSCPAKTGVGCLAEGVQGVVDLTVLMSWEVLAAVASVVRFGVLIASCGVCGEVGINWDYP
jgi:hypothetical protein